ncbi:MAG: hypothetical protein I8H75_01755 [Myxococcaceae bacterium]|nr:hypothetical protein [Myxococcaceae bacterium]
MKHKKSYEDLEKERIQKIKELRKKIWQTRSHLQLDEEESLGDMLTELSELLDNPAPSDSNEDESPEFDLNPKSVKGLSPSNHFIIPGIRMAAPKKSGGSGGGKKSEVRKDSSAQAQTETETQTGVTVVSAAQPSTLAPASGFIQVSGPAPVPMELQTVLNHIINENIALKNENAALKNENTALKKETQDLRLGLQRETDRSAIHERDLQLVRNEYRTLLESYGVLQAEVARLRTENEALRIENEALRQDNKQLKERLTTAESQLQTLQSELQILKQRSDQQQYMLEVGQALGYINDEIRRVFDDPASPGFPGIQRMARRDEFRGEESRIWAEFLRAHPGADDMSFARVFAEIMGDRVGVAHPGRRVDTMREEELYHRILTIKPNLEESFVRKFVDFIFTFPVPDQRR